MRPLFAHLMKETANCSPRLMLPAEKRGAFRRTRRSQTQEQAV